jgi:hypothetical protein
MVEFLVRCLGEVSCEELVVAEFRGIFGNLMLSLWHQLYKNQMTGLTGVIELEMTYQMAR